MRSRSALLLRLCWLLPPLLALAACGQGAPAARPGGEGARIRVSGAFALFPMMTIWADEYHKLNPDVTFDVQAGGAGKGMADVLSGLPSAPAMAGVLAKACERTTAAIPTRSKPASETAAPFQAG